MNVELGLFGRRWSIALASTWAVAADARWWVIDCTPRLPGEPVPLGGRVINTLDGPIEPAGFLGEGLWVDWMGRPSVAEVGANQAAMTAWDRASRPPLWFGAAMAVLQLAPRAGIPFALGILEPEPGAIGGEGGVLIACDWLEELGASDQAARIRSEVGRLCIACGGLRTGHDEGWGEVRRAGGWQHYSTGPRRELDREPELTCPACGWVRPLGQAPWGLPNFDPLR